MNDVKINVPELASFYKDNAGFNILKFNFLDQKAVSKLKINKKQSPVILKELMAYQRLLRLYPDVTVAKALMADNLDSSAKITSISKTKFIRTYGPGFGPGGPGIARKIYAAAVHARDRTMHLVASAKSLAVASQFKDVKLNNIPAAVAGTFQDLPSYREFFGSLDYCTCSECKSIFGPAAYLVDLLRIIDQGITQPNADKIQAGLTLFERRPDLQTIELTCENTNRAISYLKIVNNVLQNVLETYLKKNKSLAGDDLYLTLANSYFPFNLPFNLPLQQILAVLDEKKVRLADIALALSKDRSVTEPVAAKILKMSPERLGNIKAPAPKSLAATVSKNYGLELTDKDLKGLDQVSVFLKQTGLSLKDLQGLLKQNLSAQECFDVSGEYSITAFGPTLTLKQTGSSVSGTYGKNGTLQGAIDDQVLQGQWSSTSQAPPAQNGDFKFTFTPGGKSFSGKWSKGLGLPWEPGAWDGTLNGTSTHGIIPHSLFINGTLSRNHYLKIIPSKDGDTIEGQSLGSLDRLNRFIRLSAATGWSYVDLNWLLTTLDTDDISDTTFIELSKARRISDTYSIDFDLLSCLWFDIKTIGMGPTPRSQAPFDKIFNDQVTGDQIYRPLIAKSATSFVNPLYKDQPLPWVVDRKTFEGTKPNAALKQSVNRAQTVVKGIPASQDDVLAVALAIFGKVATVELTVSNLSALYRHVMLAGQLNLTIAGYVVLLRLLGFGNKSGDSFLISPVLDRDQAWTLLKTGQKIQAAGFTVFDIDYLCNQTYNAPISPFTDPGYNKFDLPGFFATVQTVLAGGICRSDSFTYSGLSRTDSEQVFAALTTQGVIGASGLVAKDPSAVNWTSIKVGGNVLGSSQQDFVASKLKTLRDHQEQLFAGQIGAFFSATEKIASLTIQAVSAGDPAYLEPFIATGNSSQAKETFILTVSKGLMLQGLAGLNESEFSSVCLCPNAYGISALSELTPASVLTVANLKPTIEAFGDANGRLVEYFRDVSASPAPTAETLQARLCSVTQWNLDQYVSLTQIILTKTAYCKTLMDVRAVQKVFAAAGALGIDFYSLQVLDQMTALAATAANWPAYEDAATKLSRIIQAEAGSGAVQDPYKKITDSIEAKKRDALLDFSIWVLGQQWTDIQTPRNLYEFLLIDPENGGCAEISIVKEALNAAQLYLQRCRLNLEKDVHISTDDIPDVWWEWILNYRIWEGNRKIFLYPENYIDPSLRKSKTNLFQDLENTLLQGEVTKDTVAEAYLKYLDDFSNLARLRYVDAYQTVVHDKERGEVDTLFLFARTQEQPYHFYYITRETVGQCKQDRYLWSEWKNINIKIDAEHVTPMYAFNKLYVFWVELTTTKETGGLTGKVGSDTDVRSQSNLVTKAAIKYSYFNFNEKWVQPQTLVADQVVNVHSTESLYGSFLKQFTNTDSPVWKKVSVLKTGPKNYIGGPKSPNENLVVYFGPLASFSDLGTLPVAPNIQHDSASVYAFKKMLMEAYFNLGQLQSFNRPGYIPLCSHYVLDENLYDQSILRPSEYLVLASNGLSPYMIPTFTANVFEKSLAIAPNYATLVTNNGGGLDSESTSQPAGPQVIGDTSFVVPPYIDETASKTIKDNISKNMSDIIDGSSKIKKEALSKTTNDISSKLGVSENEARLVQNRFYELFYGSLVLFANVEHGAGVVTVKNQPGTFIFDNGGEAFLVSATNNVIETTVSVLTPDSFQSSTLTKKISESYFKTLSTVPNNYILKDGTVNAALLKNAQPVSIGILLAMQPPYAEAGNILKILKKAQAESGQNIVQKKFDKIDSQLRISAALTPDAFASGSIDRSTSATYYKILSTPPNQYIQADGSVDPDLAKKVTPSSIAPLLGLQPSDSKVTKILNTLKSAANLITRDSFVTPSLITESESQTYFTSLSTSPNNYILPDGSINSDLMASVTKYAIWLLLGQPQNNLVVERVLYVLGTPGPVALGYVYPEGPSAASGKTVNYDHDNIFCLQFDVERLSTGAISQISHALSFGGIDSALALSMQQLPVNIKKPFSHLEPITGQLDAPLSGPVLVAPALTSNHEVAFKGPYGEYYWELFFHSPFLVASMLNSNQKFAEAEKWLQYIFDPTMQKRYLTKEVFVEERPQDIDAGTMEDLYPILTTSPNHYIDDQGNVTVLVEKATPYALKLLLGLSMDQSAEILNLLKNYYVNQPQVRAWQFFPFRNYTLKTLLQNLSSCAQITEYNDDPFDPDAIARLRIGAYEKTIFMKYIDNLLDWGDFEFTKYSWESITAARMYYSYAHDLLGPKPVDVAACPASFPVTFQDIAARYKDGTIPQFLLDMEHLAGKDQGGTAATGAVKAYNDLGYYFCIPDNAILVGYWDRVEKQMYKIRHCLNIEGVAQPLPLFQPPINPMDLVRAAALGGNVLNVADQQRQNISYYRFTHLIERAKSVANLVSEFGNTLLSALEKSDAESLALLHLNQAKTILNMTTNVKEKQLESLQKQSSGLQQSLQNAQNRNTFYTKMITAGYNAAENSGIDFLQSSIETQEVAAGIQGVSIAGFLAPCIVGFSDGGMKFGDAINMGAQILQTASQISSQKGGLSQTVAQYQRRKEDWQLQQQVAQYETAQIKEQIASMKANIASAQQELAIQKKTIKQNEDETDFYKSKFTDQELYQWMIARVSAVYFQAYKLALDIALGAQMSYQYELDRDDSFITFGYWDNLHKGLLAAGGLRLSLSQLENAYYENNERRLEIVKTISLKTINPEAFYAFQSGANQGSLLFSLTEELFDRDFPSHYCRCIKSVSVSLPAVVGPYQNIHATLTQNTNLVVLKPDKDVVNYAIYQTAPQKSGQAPAEPQADGLRQNWVSNQQIAISKGVDDSGLFVLNFEDQRYLPFEGTGAVSTWTFSMPPQTNPIDFAGISDVILTVEYTAREGGAPFGQDVVNLYNKNDEPQYQNIRANSISVDQAFSGAWYVLFQTAPDKSGKQTLQFPMPDLVLPNLKGVKLNAIVIDLETASGPEIANNKTGLALTVGKGSYALEIKNNRAAVKSTDITKIKQWQGVDWSLVFTPAQLGEISTNKKLDSSKLTNVIVTVMYTSDM